MVLPFAQRLHDLSDHVRQDEQLLKSYEDALRLEDDPPAECATSKRSST